MDAPQEGAAAFDERLDRGDELVRSFSCLLFCLRSELGDSCPMEVERRVGRQSIEMVEGAERTGIESDLGTPGVEQTQIGVLGAPREVRQVVESEPGGGGQRGPLLPPRLFREADLALQIGESAPGATQILACRVALLPGEAKLLASLVAFISQLLDEALAAVALALGFLVQLASSIEL